jgi:hemolysin III
MLACSAAYNLAVKVSPRALLRRLDQAAIFLMIAGTYTPFTTCRLHGAWAIGLTATVWIGAVFGAVLKLLSFPHLERVSVAAYLGLGWMILVGLHPLLASVDATSVV